MKKIFESLLYLIQKDKEWGGYINLSTGEIQGPFEGNKKSFEWGTPEEERKKSSSGWARFHSHPDDGYNIPEPSTGDKVTAHLCGGKSFVITKRGVWEVKTLKVFTTVEEIRRADEKAWAKAEELEYQHGDPAYWFWAGWIETFLPTEVSLICPLLEEK